MASATGRNHRVIPGTPRVISPSPTPSDTKHDQNSTASYFGPTTRASAAIRQQNSTTSTLPIEEEQDAKWEDESRARTRSRSPIVQGNVGDRRRMSGLTTAKSPKSEMVPSQAKGSPDTPVEQNGSNATAKGHLSPSSANGRGAGPASYWRELSRSPSPLGLIPIHRHWRSLVGLLTLQLAFSKIPEAP